MLADPVRSPVRGAVVDEDESPVAVGPSEIRDLPENGPDQPFLVVDRETDGDAGHAETIPEPPSSRAGQEPSFPGGDFFGVVILLMPDIQVYLSGWNGFFPQ